MLEIHRLRRLEASRARTAGRLGLTDPLFNLREVVKHMLLLEDHLANETKRCPDCIRKHLLTIEALADEGQCLDCTGLWSSACGDMAERCRQWSESLIDGTGAAEVGQEIRKMRKQLTPLVFDPRQREAVARVASAYLHREAGKYLGPSITPPDKFYDRREAEKKLRQLQSDPDDDWTYRIVEIPNKRGLVRIEILDESGEHVGWFGM